MSEVYPSAAECVPIGALVLRTLSDLERWAAEHLPSFPGLPLASMALGEAVMGPWATAEQLRPCGRVAVWTYAIDDHVEHDVTSAAELDDLFDRCRAVVCTGRRDDGHPVLASLSGLQATLAAQPLYPALATLWERRFDACLRAMRYDWIVGRRREDHAGPVSSIDEYLANADSILIWMVHLPRWIVYGDPGLTDRLDILIPALEDVTVAVRLANDLSTYVWEKQEKGQNNVLMHGASPDWVRAEISARMESVRQRMAPLAAEGFRPAVGVLRLAEWSVGIYALTDLRLTKHDLPQPVEPSGV